MMLKLLLCAATLLLLCVFVVSEEEAHDAEPVAATTVSGAVFFENFQDDWESRWTQTSVEKFSGVWVTSEGDLVGSPGDKGLVVNTTAAHHAISAVLPKPLKFDNNDFVVQYEVRLQNGLDCGGAYLKLLIEDKNFDGAKFDNEAPYSIMFGPDKCGNNDKVHFIFRHQNPVSKEWEEKHLKSPPSIKTDKRTHLYTLVVRKDNTFSILIDNSEVKSGSLLEDFDPPVNPPKEIDDPKDKKPATWVDDPKMPDPEATKPDDWDEDQPREIEDMDAVKPASWHDDEPDYIEDPEAKMPEDWDTEEDGDWSGPQIPNPKCQESGCGEWKRPKIANPLYKGKWSPPMIDNPDYVGPWAPRKIENPHFFVDEHPCNFATIGAIGFELWTMSRGIMFDNILIHTDPEVAKDFAEASWAVRAKAEAKLLPEPTEKGTFERIVDSIARVYEANPIGMLVALVLGLLVLLIPIYFMCCSGSDDADDSDRASAAAHKKNDDAQQPSDAAPTKAADAPKKPADASSKKSAAAAASSSSSSSPSTEKKETTARRRKGD